MEREERKIMRWIFVFLVCLVAVVVSGCGGEFDDGEYEYETLTAADCYDDEVYDEVDQWCYLACEVDGTCAEGGGLGSWLSGLQDSLFGEGFGMSEDEVAVLISYDVDGNKIVNPVENEASNAEEEEIIGDSAEHSLRWREFANLIPLENRWMISTYGVFTDGEENTMAYVEPDPDEPKSWLLAVDYVDAKNPAEQTYTLIHEYGHLLTLNDRQVPFDAEAYYAQDDASYEQAVSQCATHFAGEGCSRQTSYINEFFNRFWADIHDEWLDAEENGGEDAVYELADKYQDRFITDYAATNIGEDIAESWTHFVLKDKPTGNSVADQKVLFFYEYPELVTLRNQILARGYSISRERR